MNQIAKIYYPPKKLIKKTDERLDYIFKIENKYLELSVQGFTEYKFLYGDGKYFIVRKNVNTFLISFDNGESYKHEVNIKNLKVYQVYPLSNGSFLVCGVTTDYKAYVYVFDKDLKEIAKHQQGMMGWHSQDSIDEYKGTIMYVEYQNFEKGAPLPKTINVFRSKDFGKSWEIVFTKKHPQEVRHGHTLQVDKFTGNWLVTFGNTPSQSRWFLSKDNGNSWQEITDKTYKLEEFPDRSQCAHRTTSIKLDEKYYYWSTDDFMGNTNDYFTEYKGRRKTSAKIYRSLKSEPLHLEEMSNIGIHGRCMIDIGKGYIILTEAKYATHNMQVYYVAKTDLKKVYFLFDIYGYKRHAGPASMCSKVINKNYFYTAIAKNMFLNSEYQTLKWNFNFPKNINTEVGYNIEDFIKFEEHLWFLDKTTSIENISFLGNGVKLYLNDKKFPFYLLLGDAKVDRFNSKELFKLDSKKNRGALEVNIDIPGQIGIKIYLQFFDETKKASWKSFILKKGLNRIDFEIEKEFKYLKILFRIENNSNQKNVAYLKDLKFTYSNIPSKKLKNNMIFNFSKPDSNISLFFFQNNKGTFEQFKPRDDSKIFKISYPLDWSIDPFRDRNWCFQLHAWRMMDPLLIEYSKSRKIDLLKKCLTIINDWKSYTFEQKKETSFTWYDMATGLRALKLTYLANIIFNTPLESKIDIKSKENILFLLKKHIEVLKNQKIAMNNHGLFQLHGLIMASSLVRDKDGIEYGLKKMDTLIERQFYPDGFHVENSDKYHGFVLNIFKRIINFSEYQNDGVLTEIINKALFAWKFTVFPNLDPLMIGDTDYKIRKIKFENNDLPNTYFMQYFKDSGYVFVRSSFVTKSEEASMLFMQTAFKHTTHRHADDFNILLYEFGKNILVDAGQHSYDTHSVERKYVLSTRAHNTVMIDNQDYKIHSKYYYESALVLREEKNGIFLLKTSLKRKDIEVEHNRLIFYKPAEFLIVIDKLDSDVKRSYKQIWHLHEDLEITREETGYTTYINGMHRMDIELMVLKNYHFVNNKDIFLVKGQTELELQGWRSLKYKQLVPNYALEHATDAKEAVLMTRFSFNGAKVEIKVEKNIIALPTYDIEVEL